MCHNFTGVSKFVKTCQNMNFEVFLMHPHTEISSSYRAISDVIHVRFIADPRQVKRGPKPKPKQPLVRRRNQLVRSRSGNPIAQEMYLILESYRKHIGITGPFQIDYDNSYRAPVSWNHHDFIFWGENVGKECKEREDSDKGKKGCKVVFRGMGDDKSEKIDAGEELATVYFDSTKELFTVRGFHAGDYVVMLGNNV
ncbi:hypothetical protein DFH05DRAFT_1460451 [Lentinula detonsa]|uniref:Uncharacterized protein n=1 Tax=Lentinula detonsa TaxID=2804962 RepID=A0A9W8P040_9AGAR|nr:hypothetical protein DFH05DRAFT_1460451 [Lentinula detonsa]